MLADLLALTEKSRAAVESRNPDRDTGAERAAQMAVLMEWGACLLAGAVRRPGDGTDSTLARHLRSARDIADAAMGLSEALLLPFDWLMAWEVRAGIAACLRA